MSRRPLHEELTRLCCSQRRRHQRARKRPRQQRLPSEKNANWHWFSFGPNAAAAAFCCFIYSSVFIYVYNFLFPFSVRMLYASLPLTPPPNRQSYRGRTANRPRRVVIETTMPKTRDCDGCVFGRSPKIKTKHDALLHERRQRVFSSVTEV